MYSDEELIEKYHAGDERACDILLERYKNLVRKKAKAMFIAGGDSDDLIQEGMIGLYKAIRSYSKEKEASFMTFASMCINRQMCSAVSAANRKKHNPLNSYVSFYSPVTGEEGSETVISDILVSEKEQNPEDIIIQQERADNIENKIYAQLSDFEVQVIKCYMKGDRYVEIAAKLGKTPKSIDNALQRIKTKVLSVL